MSLMLYIFSLCVLYYDEISRPEYYVKLHEERRLDRGFLSDNIICDPYRVVMDISKKQSCPVMTLNRHKELGTAWVYVCGDTSKGTKTAVCPPCR